MTCYEIAVAAPLRKTLTYARPFSLPAQETIDPGRRVLVPLGRRVVTGYVLTVIDEAGTGGNGIEIKPITELLDQGPLFLPAMIPFFRWIAEYYHHPLGEVIRTALPGGLTGGSGRKVLLDPAFRDQLAASLQTAEGLPSGWGQRLLQSGELAPGTVAGLRRDPAVRSLLARWEKLGWIRIEEEVHAVSVRQKMQRVISLAPETAARIRQELRKEDGDMTACLALLFPELKTSARKTLALICEFGVAAAAPPVLQPAITRQYSGAGNGLRELAAAGIIRCFEKQAYRDPFGGPPSFLPKPLQLTPDQQEVLQQLLPAIGTPSFRTFLLHGVTGCGKTEVYLRATEAVLTSGLSVLVLVPEIALASQLEAQFYSRFGGQVAVLHSGLSEGERHDQWQRILSGQARVVIGARSAVFAPLHSLGLVIVDEEHEPAYKQEDGLRYNGRDLAVLRASFSSCPVILGSATPSVISYHHALTGKYTLLSMPRRIEGQSLPRVEVVNLALSRTSRPDLFFSDPLIRALKENMEKRRQSLLFVNRRGFASFMLCRDCGHIVQCRHCQVSLTLHRREQRLVCHYCGYSLTTRIVCPACTSPKMDGLGLGSERIEDEVRQLIPHARVARLDSDAATSRKQYLATLRAVREGDVDILVGTQMIAKGLHFPNITLVGVVWADSGLGMPDFRAAERTFQLLAQVTGRAGRGEHPGKVIIQTYQPHHYSVLCAQQHDYPALYNKELSLRRDLRYPPFSRLVNIRISGRDEAKVKDSAGRVGHFLRSALARRRRDAAVEILGPAPAPLARIKDKSRWQVLLKSSRLALLHELCEQLLEDSARICGRGISLAIDVDPENMM
ncbi:MAG TPA: primosomal protein N' [Desulfobulbaceae bacterium]|nr:primosomal protein N' [Desulfobulbaceae bacterium]